MRSIEDLFGEFQRTGDPACVGEVYDRSAAELFHLARHLCDARSDPEDVLSATFLTAIERRASFDPRRRLMPWLIGILTRHVSRARRRASRRPDPERLAERRAASDPALDAEERELATHLDRSLLDLPEQFRSVLILRLRHGLSAAQIAHSLQRPPGTVRSQLARGLQQLRRTLRPGLVGALTPGLPPLHPAGAEPALAAVRVQVLAHAGTALVPASVIPSVTGLLVMKKLVASIVLVAIGLVSWRLVTSVEPPSPGFDLPSRPAGALVDAPLEPLVPTEVREALHGTDAVRDGGTAERAASERSRQLPRAAATGSLLVRAWKEGPFVGELVIVRSFGPDAAFPGVYRALTDERGVATFDALPPGRTQVQLLRGAQDETSIRAGVRSELDLRLRPGALVHGVVVDERGRPVAGADIWISERWRVQRGHLLARSDGDGRFRVEALSADHAIGARKAGFAPSCVQTVLAHEGDSAQVRVVLERASAGLEGRVVGRDGLPVAAAQLQLGSEEERELDRADTFVSYAAPPLRTGVDVEGCFRFDSVPAGVHALRVRAPGRAPAVREVVLVEGVTGRVDVVLEEQARLTGQVLDSAGDPVSEARVALGSWGRFLTTGVFSGADGRYLLSGLPAGEVEVEVHEAQGGRIAQRLLLVAGDVQTWNPVLDGHGRIAGRVVGPDRRPCEGWTVVARVANATVERARTDAAGRFSLIGLEAGSYTLLVNDSEGWRGFPRATLREVEVDAAELVIEVRPDRRATLAGRVLAPGGGAAAGARISVWHEGQRLYRTFPVDAGTGAFRVEGIPAGECHVSAECDDFPRLDLGPQQLVEGEERSLPEAHFADAGRLALQVQGVPPEHLASLAFLVTDARGGEAGRMRVAAAGFLSEPLEAGEYELFSRGDHLVSRRDPFTIEVGATTSLELDFEAAGQRVVRFTRPAGLGPARRLWCSVQDAAGREVWRQGNVPLVDGQRRARVSVAPGTYRLVAQAGDGRRAEEPFVVHGFEGADPPLTVRLVVH